MIKFKTPLQIAVFFSLLAVFGKMAVFLAHKQHGDFEFYIIVYYLILLLMTVFFGIRQFKLYSDEKETKYFDDVKAGARAGIMFTLIIGLFTYFYYKNVDTEFFRLKQEQAIETIKQTALEKLKAGKSQDEVMMYLKNQILGVYTMLTPYFQAMMTIFLMTFMSVFHALILAVFMRKIPGFTKAN